MLAGRHLAWVADGGADPSTAVRVTAQLLGPDGAPPRGLSAVVDVGDTAGGYGQRVPARIVHLTGAAAAGGPAGSQWYVKAERAGLRPGTVHHYRLRLSDGTATGDAHFATAPSPYSTAAQHASDGGVRAALDPLFTGRSAIS